MNEYSFLDRVSTILDMITSSGFFVALFITICLTIIILVIDSKVRKKWIKYGLGFVYFGIMIYVVYRYGNYALSLNDSFVERVFTAMYFPNLVTYISMMIITVFVMISAFINKKTTSFSKILYLVFFGIIWFLFVLVLDTVKSNNIDIYDKVSIYSDESLMILLQASMYVFFIWIAVIVINYIVSKLTKVLDGGPAYANTVENRLISAGEYNGELEQFSDEDFNNGFIFQEKMKKETEYKDIVDRDSFGL